MSNRSRTILTIAGVALLYVLCAKLGLAPSFRAAQVTAVWPPTGFAAGGLGLGLTLVRRLVELHGGTVEAASDPRGTEITLRVPTVSAEQTAEPVPSASPVATRSRRVLVVEDNDDARVMLSELLTTRGHEVETAVDGAGAIAAAQRFVPEVVLLDIGLPGADGYAVARELRGIPECAGALLVAVTGYGQPEDRARAREAGFDEHLLKPVEAERLLELLA